MPPHDLPCTRTERFAEPFDTSWTPVGDALLADTPECRESNYGHRLVLGGAPDDWEVPVRRWRDAHAGKGVKTAWLNLEAPALEPPTPVVPPGLKLETTTTGRFPGSRATAVGGPPGGYEVRLVRDDDWPALHASAVAINEWTDDVDGQRYLDHVIVGRRRQHAEGRLRQWLAVDASTGAVAGMAAVVEGAGEARFQDVQTVAEHRRRGLCTALIAAALADHRGRRPDWKLWLNVHPDGPAAGVYARLGFVPETTMWSVSAPAPRDEAQILTLTAAFEASTLPVAQWHHREHVTVGVQFLRDADLEVAVALERMRGAIHRFLDAHGVVTTDGAGYHETLTRGWLEVVAGLLRDRPAESLEDAVLGATLRLGDKRHLLRHWSKERLMSSESRAAWVEPDVAPL